jgi:hypothetical protein
MCTAMPSQHHAPFPNTGSLKIREKHTHKKKETSKNEPNKCRWVSKTIKEKKKVI